MEKLRKGVGPAKTAAASINPDQPGSNHQTPLAAEKAGAEEPFNIQEEIELLIEIQDILDELDILKMVRKWKFPCYEVFLDCN